MIVVRLSAHSVAGVRLAPSPASDIVAWLGMCAAGRQHPLLGDPGSCARLGLRHPDVVLIATLLRSSTGYVPDFLTPKPSAGGWTQILSHQLDAVRETSAETVAAQLLIGRSPGQPMPADVRRAMESGTFGRRAANGLHHFWHAALADSRRTLEAAAAADLRRRAWSMAVHGIGATLDSLHTKLRWSGDHLRIDMRYEEETDLANEELVLSPAILGWPRLRVQVCDPGNAVIVYPASAFDVNGHRAPPRVATLVGSTRAAILASLTTPSTTTQLSRDHGLAPSTVSHHLGVLVRAGMAVKARTGGVVHYARTERGDALLRTDRSPAT